LPWPRREFHVMAARIDKKWISSLMSSMKFQDTSNTSEHSITAAWQFLLCHGSTHKCGVKEGQSFAYCTKQT
jgi:hypothetical protein